MSAPSRTSPPHWICKPTPEGLLQALREQIARVETPRRPGAETPVSSGCRPLDALLPQGGFPRGTLVEWLAAGAGSGAETLALCSAREACREGGALVVLDRAGEFYPPAAARLGIELERTIVVHARTQADNLWALDQALRCAGVAVVLARPERLDGKTFRRLQLAAEQEGVLGLLLRPESVRHEPSWADVRLLVEPVAQASPAVAACADRRRLKVHVLRSRGSLQGRSVEVEIDHETHPLPVDSRPVGRAWPRRAAGA